MCFKSEEETAVLDNTTLLDEKIMKVKVHCEKLGIRLKIKKAKLMAVSPATNLRTDSEDVEVVNSVCLSRLTVNSKGTNNQETCHKTSLV